MPTELRLPVTGMTCGGCENAVKRAVGALPGVTAVTASHQAGEVVITFDAGHVSQDQIIAKITALGYHVHLQP
jgi:copper chaperone CopZ